MYLPKMKLCILVSMLSTFIAGAFSHEEDIYTIQYTDQSFSEELPKQNHFVMFYAPWCGHCQRLRPTWEELAELLNTEDGNVKIAKVDCTIDHKTCQNHDVTGYPTLKFFKKGEEEGVKFKGTRDMATLSRFINEQLIDREEEERRQFDKKLQEIINESGLVELNEDNFEKRVSEGKHFIKFYAPWCGFCQKLAPIWDDLAKAFNDEPTITIAKIDCTQHKSVCSQYEIKGYPTLLWFEEGKKVDKYQGQRTLDDLTAYVKNVGGGLLSSDEKVHENILSEKMVNELDATSFQSSIRSGVSMVEFYAPWCGHCKQLAPTWEHLGKKYANNKAVKIVKVDCTTDVNQKLCMEENVEGFPTIYLYKNGQKVSEYQGARSLEKLQDFIDGHLSHDEL